MKQGRVFFRCNTVLHTIHKHNIFCVVFSSLFSFGPNDQLPSVYECGPGKSLSSILEKVSFVLYFPGQQIAKNGSRSSPLPLKGSVRIHFIVVYYVHIMKPGYRFVSDNEKSLFWLWISLCTYSYCTVQLYSFATTTTRQRNRVSGTRKNSKHI